MKAQAPGKVVISGAYAVLHGAPALVSAVDRYVIADSARPAEFITPEVRAGLTGMYPTFDASALREDGRKLGLGSSAAILVASLVAAEYPDLTADDGRRTELFHRCLIAHRKAQDGGSGIDVTASVFGGTLEYQLPAPGSEPSAMPRLTARTLPPLCMQLWASDRAASTSEFLARVRALRDSAKETHDHLMGQLMAASTRARDAARATDPAAFLEALAAQADGLDALGAAAGIPIFIPELQVLGRYARTEDAVVLPAGAGGGDIALYVGHREPSQALLAECARLGHRPLQVRFAVQGAMALGE